MNIQQPTLLLDESRCRANIALLAEKAHRNRLNLMPHSKTHQSAQVGEWLREQGISRITVSSLSMAAYFARHGWREITVAVPFNVHEMPLVNELAAQIRLHLLVVNPQALAVLIEQAQHPVGFFVEVDTGYKRTGIAAHEVEQVRELILQAKGHKFLKFSGLYTHAGHSYRSRSREQIIAVQRAALSTLHYLRQSLGEWMIGAEVVYGDTPTCSIAETFEGVDTLSPGNFIFYDLTQAQITSCRREQIALAVYCPVIATYPDRQQVVIYGGSAHFSKDSMEQGDRPIFGLAVVGNAQGWDASQVIGEVISLSQEHGVVEMSTEQIARLRPGDWLVILPVHACLAGLMHRGYLTTEGRWIEKM